MFILLHNFRYFIPWWLILFTYGLVVRQSILVDGEGVTEQTGTSHDSWESE
jgi:hypothetical protein